MQDSDQLAPDPGRRRIEAVGLVASAGGLEALGAVLRGLPADFPAAVVIVQHLSPQAT